MRIAAAMYIGHPHTRIVSRSHVCTCHAARVCSPADLKFPHHENQIAQAEAHFNCCDGTGWVNYFLHSGHLQIDGLKMSKSLKNFITIKGALEAYSPSQIRFLFLLRRFSEPMEYAPLPAPAIAVAP